MKWLKNNALNILIVLVFVVTTLIIGYNHEPWEDEVQSWLIARDANCNEIIWRVARYEGTFPLWQLTIKLFMMFGLTFKYYFIISVIISTIGLIVFLNKVKCPLYLKILFPFTYFVFYQYTIVARSYTFLFLAFSLIAAFYNERLEKTGRYILSLILMSMISTHGMFISLIMGIYLFYEKIVDKSFINDIWKFLLLIVIGIFEGVVLAPPVDLYMNVTAMYSLKEIFFATFDTFINTGSNIQIIYNIIVCLLMLYFLIILFINKKYDLLITFGVLLIFMVFVRCLPHHLGILSYLVLFGIIMNLDKIKEKNKHINKVLLIICLFYVLGSLVTSYNDIRYKYNASGEIADYIKNIEDYENKKINGIGFYSVAIEGYFDDKIYDNWNNMTYYKYSLNNKDFYNFVNFNDIDKKYLIENDPDYVVLKYVDENSNVKEAKIMNYLKEHGYEKKLQTEDAKMFYKLSSYASYGYVIFGK